jgi:hypothetical protein
VATLIWLALGLVWLVSLLPFLYARRVIDQVQWPVWTEVLEGHAARHVAYLRDLYADESQVVVEGIALAQSHFARGQRERARQVLCASLQALAECSGAARLRVREWWLACRAAASLVPVPPLARGAFRLARLRQLSGLHRVAHTLPVTSGERFRLRLRLLDWGFAIVGRYAKRAPLPQPQRSTLDSADTWTQAHDLALDFQALCNAALDSLCALLNSAQSGSHDRSGTSGTSGLGDGQDSIEANGEATSSSRSTAALLPIGSHLP